MNCQNCEAPVDAAAEHCGKCGAKLLRRRIVFGAQRREEFVLTAEDQSDEGEPGIDAGEWQIDDREVSATPIERAPEAAAAKIRYGGFFRRLCAAVIDLVIVLLLSAVMGGMAYIGYKVGLRAHDRALTTGNMTPLLGLLTFGWALLLPLTLSCFTVWKARPSVNGCCACACVITTRLDSRIGSHGCAG